MLTYPDYGNLFYAVGEALGLIFGIWTRHGSFCGEEGLVVCGRR